MYNLSVEAASIVQKCLNSLNGFIIDNMSVQEKSKGGFSVWDIAKEKNKKGAWKYCAYVHYDHKEKVAVATDGYVLYVSHKEYKPLSYCFKREGKTVRAILSSSKFHVRCMTSMTIRSKVGIQPIEV